MLAVAARLHSVYGRLWGWGFSGVVATQRAPGHWTSRWATLPDYNQANLLASQGPGMKRERERKTSVGLELIRLTVGFFPSKVSPFNSSLTQWQGGVTGRCVWFIKTRFFPPLLCQPWLSLYRHDFMSNICNDWIVAVQLFLTNFFDATV